MTDVRKTTELGKLLRKMRIERDERLLDMADKVGKPASFVSAIEFGKKPAPEDFIDAVVREYRLSAEQAEELRVAADRSRRAITLQPNDPAARDMAGLLARKIDALSPEALQAIKDILKKA